MSNYKISAPAWHTANVLLENFELVRRPAARVEPTAKNVAILIDVCTSIFRVESALDTMLKSINWQDKNELARNLDQLQQALRAVDMVRSRIPRYGNPEEADPTAISTAFGTNGRGGATTAEAAQSAISSIQSEKNSRLSAALKGARTIEQEQAVLRQAGIVR